MSEISIRQTSTASLKMHRGFADTAAFRFWVVQGFIWFALCVYCWGSWVAGPDFTPNTIGRADASQAYVYWVRSLEIISLIATLYIFYRFVLMPILKVGRLSFDGLFVLSCWMMYIQEPWINYTQHQFLYNTVAVNFGSWTRYVPGWISPNSELIPVGTLLWCTAYLTLVAMPAIAGSRFMTWMRNKKPDIGLFQLIGTAFLAFCVFDLVLESIILRTGLFNYASTVPSLTLWAGEPHQFPIYEMLSWCMVYTGLACIHHFRDDKGLSFAERGSDRVMLPRPAKTFMRFLAIMGLCQLVFLFSYNVPYQYWSLQGAAYPEYAEYRTAGVCGPNTAYDCPAPDVPVVRPGVPTNRP